jgi:predicted Abi (CAAX) family protease
MVVPARAHETAIEVPEAMSTRLLSIREALRTIPGAGDWRRLVGLYLGFVAVACLAGFSTGFFNLDLPRTDPKVMFLVPLGLLLRPVVVEELGFRALLLPHPRERCSRIWVLSCATASLVAYVASHPLNGLFLRPSLA